MRSRLFVASMVVLLCAATIACRSGDALDEPNSGRTLRGTPVAKRGIECFPTETRDLLWEMDQVAHDGRLQSLDFDANGDGRVDDAERDAIRGRNTWVNWGAGNEAFWGWLQEQGYGITDFLILLDSRQRDHRFANAGLINQPGFASSTEPILGLYLDREEDLEKRSALLMPPHESYETDHSNYSADYHYSATERYDAQYRNLAQPVEREKLKPSCFADDQHRFSFMPWTTRAEWKKSHPDQNSDDNPYIPEVMQEKLVQDGFDPAIYGYASGVVGLRLYLNPDFFANTPDAERAREYWRERVEKTNGRYYTTADINADPDLVRPFRVAMSCGFCHVGPHPLLPPTDNEHPEWKNLSGIIGGQYWNTQPTIGNLLPRRNFLFHFLRSQAPGTVDTSLISTDQINNTNVINAVFDVPARLARAAEKPTEKQSEANLLVPGVEDEEGPSGDPRCNGLDRNAKSAAASDDQRHFPMVLFPGEDSIGVFGALARVYLNIGLFSQQWNRVDNPVIGFTPQRPFSIATARKNSVFWNVNECQRVGYLAKFFTLGSSHVPKSTAPMRLKDAPGGKEKLAKDSDESRRNGRRVFLGNCAICHSSKQPPGFHLKSEPAKPDEWRKENPKETDPPVYTLPLHYSDWEEFKKSADYVHYQERLNELDDVKNAPDGSIGAIDPFFENNFLSNELRIPVTLVGTYSGRAMATNAMRGQVWDNFSSEDFKALPSVGAIQYYDPYSGSPKVPLYGTNASYTDGRKSGGPGYFRPASLISIWATAPYFHNNTLGIYTHDPSVAGRLDAFNDAIKKLLWNEKRDPRNASDPRIAREGLHPGDLRLDGDVSAANDPGYIYRTPLDTQFSFHARFIRPLIEGVLTGYLGPFFASVILGLLTTWLWVALALLAAVGVFRGRARHVGAVLASIAVVLALVLVATGLGGFGGTALGAMMMMIAESLASVPALWLWLIAALFGGLGYWLLLTGRDLRRLTRSVFALIALLSLGAGYFVHETVAGRRGGIELDGIPRGTPVNLLMNIDAEKRDTFPQAVIALLRARAEVKKQGLTGDAAYAELSKIAGPALMAASKVPDFVLDRGHWFGEFLSDDEKRDLIAFLKTL